MKQQYQTRYECNLTIHRYKSTAILAINSKNSSQINMR